MSEDRKPPPPCLDVGAMPIPNGVAVTFRHDATKCGGADPKGDAKNVVTDDYRTGWDRIFGGNKERGQA